MVGVILAVVLATTAHAAPLKHVTVTIYTIRGTMYEWPYEYTHEGAMACSWDMPAYSRWRFPDGAIRTCKDRGSGLGWNGWTDIWSYSEAWGYYNVIAVYGEDTWIERVDDDY